MGVCSGLSGWAEGETPEAGEIRKRLQRAAEFVEEEVAKGSVPGAALLVAQGDELLLERYVGTYCGLNARDLPFTGSVRNCTYSFAKGVSATVIAMVLNDGLFELDAPVSAYVPGYVGGGKDKTTVRHLLTHAAGVPSVPLGPVGTDEEWNAAVQMMCETEVEWEPGSKTAYHGVTGLFMAAEVARAVTDRTPWETLCRERLFAPIGADSLTFAAPSEDVPVAWTPQPETLQGAVTSKTFPFMGHPAGGAFGTVRDFLKVIQLHLKRGRWGDALLLGEPGFGEMHRLQYAEEIAAAEARGEAPTHEPWALGWLMKGSTENGWFGFGTRCAPETFGHAGINTVITVGDPATNMALAFVTTDSPKSDEETMRLRNTVTDLAAEAFASA